MPYEKENPPERIKKLPKHLQEKWMSTFNNSYKKFGESRANAIAWAAVEQNHRKNSKGQWVEKTCAVGNTMVKNPKDKKIKPIREDEHFKVYKVTLTKTGVHNGGLKSADEVRKITDNIPDGLRESLPCISDPHPKFPEIINPDLELGFTNNIRLEEHETKPNFPKIVGDDHVPKSHPEISFMLENNLYQGTSVGYRLDKVDEEGQWFDEKGEGYYYTNVEKDIKIKHNARLFHEAPACSDCGFNHLEIQECGEQNACHKKPTEIKSLDLGDGDVNMSEEPENKPVIKTEKKPLSLGDVSLNALKETNPEVKKFMDDAEQMKKELEELKASQKDITAKAEEFDKREKVERDESLEILKSTEQFSEEELGEMGMNEIKRHMRTIEATKNTVQDPATLHTAKKIKPSKTGANTEPFGGYIEKRINTIRKPVVQPDGSIHLVREA